MPLNAERIEQIRLLEANGHPGLLSQLADIAVGEFPRRVSELARAVEEKRIDSVRFESHTLAGIAASVGAMGVRDLAQALELWCRNPVPETGSALLQRLRGEAETAVEELRRLEAPLPRA